MGSVIHLCKVLHLLEIPGAGITKLQLDSCSRVLIQMLHVRAVHVVVGGTPQMDSNRVEGAVVRMDGVSLTAVLQARQPVLQGPLGGVGGTAVSLAAQSFHHVIEEHVFRRIVGQDL